MTLKSKLFAGFGLLIAVSAISGGVIVHESKVIADRSGFVLDEAVPTMLSVSNLRGGIHHALSMHRGYMILGLPALAEERLEAWDDVNGSMTELKSISADWPSDQAALLRELERTLLDFRAAQDRIAAVSHTPDDFPANKKYFGEALPKRAEMLAALDTILHQTRGLEPTPERARFAEYVGEAKTHALRVSAAISDYLAKGTPAAKSAVEAAMAGCAASVERLNGERGLLTGVQATAFDQFLARRSEFVKIANEAVALRGTPGWCVSQDICLTVVTPLAVRADEIAVEIIERQTEAQMSAGSDASEQLSHAVTMLPRIVFAAASLSLVIGVVVAMVISRSIGRSIREVAIRAHAIASRDLSIEPLVVRTKDELGELASSVNEMQSSLREIITDVSGSSQDVAAASERIMSSTEGMAAGMEQQMREVETISAAVAEMAASVSEVAASSRLASETATDSSETARLGGEVVSGVIERMNEINSAVQASAQSVTQLGQQSEQIGQIIAVINDIADQTNLLALNAAIEAARAGEHGRGFAVVADEVRKLAERTQVATEQVSRTISAIQDETRAAVQRMEAGTATVEHGVSLTRQAGTSLQGIVSSVGTVTGQVQSIAAAAEQQAAASEDISRGLSEITEVVRSSKVGTEESAAAAIELAEKAGRLREIVGRFHL